MRRKWNAREIAFEKCSITRAVARSVQERVDVGEDVFRPNGVLQVSPAFSNPLQPQPCYYVINKGGCEVHTGMRFVVVTGEIQRKDNVSAAPEQVELGDDARAEDNIPGLPGDDLARLADQ